MYIAALCAAGLSVLLTFSIRQICVRREWVASAVGDRLQHAPTPRFGGIGIVVAFGLVCARLDIWHYRRLTAILLTGFAIFALGLADDIWQISPRFKLFAQIALSVIPTLFGVSIPLTHFTLLNAAVTVLWFVGITNAFNLLDNMNGLCGGIAIVVALFRGSIALLQHDRVGFVLCITLAGAVLGFLVFNFPKGLIFMGDGGALFLGFVLAGFAFTGTFAYLKSYLDLLSLPLVLMLVPICDTTFVTVLRLLCRRPVSTGGRDHLSHSLVATGFSPVAAVVTLWLVCAGCGAISLIGTIYGSARAVTLVLILLAGLIATTSYLMRYQIFSAGVSHDLLSRTRVGGIALTVLTDLLLAAGCYYAACIVTIGGLHQAKTFFLRSAIAVLGVKLTALIFLGCYPRLPSLRAERISCVLLANALGSLVAFFAILFSMTELNVALPILDLLASATWIIGSRWYLQLLDRQCLSIATSNRGLQPLSHSEERELVEF